MLRWRVTGILATLGLLMLVGEAVRGAVAIRPVLASSGGEAASVLQVFYTPPVLVRAGERVLVPVDVVCATARGEACEATVSMAARAGAEPWHRAEVSAVKGLRFDLTEPASRAVGSGRTGRTTSLGSAARPLSFSVLRDVPVVKVEAIPFGRVRHGRTVLSLPWGSGPRRAGLQPGIEGATLGPSSFDVDAAGRVYLADPVADRVAVFRGGVLERQTAMALSSGADLAAGPAGEVTVADREDGALTVRTIAPSGRVLARRSLGPASGWQVRSAGGQVFVNSLPTDAWTALGSSSGGTFQGIPAPSGVRLLRVGTEDSVRLATISGGEIHDAVELTSDARFGEVALAEADGAGGVVVVVHVWRAGSSPADQFQVIHVQNGRVVGTFAVANTSYAEIPPLSRFRLGPDGAVYQLASTASGVAIERYPMGSDR